MIIRGTIGSFRQVMRDFAVSQKICTKCFGRKTTGKYKQCAVCREGKRLWKLKHPLLRKARPKMNEAQRRVAHRGYIKKYRKKLLANKVRKLDVIKHAMKGVK
jgi:hypothetical protein